MNTPIITLHSGPKNTKNPTLVKKKIMVSPSSSTARRMVFHTKPIPRKKKEKSQKKNSKSEQTSAYPSYDGRTYGIDRLNLGEHDNDSEGDSEPANDS